MGSASVEPGVLLVAWELLAEEGEEETAEETADDWDEVAKEELIEDPAEEDELWDARLLLVLDWLLARELLLDVLLPPPPPPPQAATRQVPAMAMARRKCLARRGMVELEVGRWSFTRVGFIIDSVSKTGVNN